MNHGGPQDSDLMLQGLMANPGLPASLLRVIITRGGLALWTAALRRPFLDDLSYRLLRDRLGTAAVDPVAAASRMIPGWKVGELAGSPLPDVRAVVAQRPDAPTHVLRLLLEDADAGVRRAAASNTSLPSGLFAWALGTGDTEVLLGMSANPALPGQVAHRLLEHDLLEIRARLARNAVLSPELAVRLADDPSPEVRIELLANALTPIQVLDGLWAERLLPADMAAISVHPVVLDRLADEWWSDAALLRTIAENPACGPETLDRLASHSMPEVRRSALGTLRVGAEALLEHATSSDPTVRSLVARSTNCPPPVLGLLGTDSVGRVRSAVARNLHCPPAVLGDLCRDEDKGVRYRCARNPGTTVADVVMLLHDRHLLVGGAAATHHALPVREMYPIVRRWAASTRGDDVKEEHS
ncbi:hypothetical protein ACIGBL_32625 [Streptomyces sp. NPDC085614]|uniref:hypothetical protein n=1 Tax=Streptomyces sp. NPDC085614 TaxID=3365733 RepID=UPI0037D0328B